MLNGATLLRSEVFQARPQPQANEVFLHMSFSENRLPLFRDMRRLERPPPAGLDSARTERGLNHDSPFVRNALGRCDIVGPGRFVINHETNRLSLAALEKGCPHKRFAYRRGV